MAFWRRASRPREDGPARADDADRVWLDRTDPIGGLLGGPAYGPDDVPQAYEPKGPAEIFDDEIDPAWRDDDDADWDDDED